MRLEFLSTLSTNIEVAHFVFETVMRVRNTEIGLGQHLTVENLVALLTEARFRFLYSKGIKEVNAEYQGLVINHVETQILDRARAREELLFEVGVQHLTDLGGDFVFKVSRMFDGSLVAYAKMGFAAYDYRQSQEIALSATIKEALDVKPFEI